MQKYPAPSFPVEHIFLYKMYLYQVQDMACTDTFCILMNEYFNEAKRRWSTNEWKK